MAPDLENQFSDELTDAIAHTEVKMTPNTNSNMGRVYLLLCSTIDVVMLQ